MTLGRIDIMNPRVKNKAFPALLASLAVLGGCGANSASVPLASQPSASAVSMPSSKGGGKGGGSGIIYLAQLYGNEIGIYQQQGTGFGLKGQFTEGVSSPLGSVTTPSGWLYVANSGNEDILVYNTKKGKKTSGGPTDTLEDYGQKPVNVDVNPSRNLVAVSNAGSASATGSVSIYLNRAAAPGRTLTYGNDILQGNGIALDNNGNCYWGVYDTNLGNGYIVEFPSCNGGGQQVITNIGDAGGLAFDQSSNLFYINRSSSMPAIVACKGLSNCVSYTFTSPSDCELYEPINLNFDKHAKALWVADAAGYVDEFAIQPGKLTVTCSVQYPVGSSNPPFGVAPNPGG